jgi:hypothetical protein
MIRQVEVIINCNKKTCGNCFWCISGISMSFCHLYTIDDEQTEYTPLKIKNGKVRRCKACKKNELSR